MNDNFQDREWGYLILSNGKRISIADPDPAMMDIETIAHALSNLCRFSGQVSKFYSVAQHSVLVSRLVPPEHALQALLHDATEAFCSDLPKPIKVMCPEYDSVEANFWEVLHKAYDIPYSLTEEVYQADCIAVLMEAKQLIKGRDWETWYPHLNEMVYQLEEPIVPMTPQEAKHYFIARYNELNNLVLEPEIDDSYVPTLEEMEEAWA